MMCVIVIPFENFCVFLLGDRQSMGGLVIYMTNLFFDFLPDLMYVDEDGIFTTKS